MDITGCHPNDLRYYPISSGGHNVIWTLSHPDELDSHRISYGWLMADASCHLDDLAGFGIPSGRVTTNSLCHQDHIPFHLMSSGWLNWGWYLIRMSYSNVVMSSGCDTLPFLSHPDDITNFDFSQHAVARICNYTHYKMWDEITYLFPNFNGAKVWISNFIPRLTERMITYPCWDWS